MDKRSISETIIALEKEAMQAWIKGDPTPFLELYSKDFSYFDPDQQLRLDGSIRLKICTKVCGGTVLMDNFEMINPLVQLSDSMAVLSYNLNIYLGEKLWEENFTSVYRLEDDQWKVIHCHVSQTKPPVS
ncbi:MAG: nuclear transport factor 2 family protein [Parabacteroides chartae]|nr:nuclear transport factor 2 family protein [Parabacteroides chartae]